MQNPALNHSPAKAHPAQTGIYIHIPYCLAKCAYCSFASSPIAPTADFAPYIAAIIKHAKILAERQPAIICDTIFIGGGTPTIIPAALLVDMLRDIRTTFNFCGDPEISIEANPNTLTPQNLAALLTAGVNRLSIGVQSFSDRLLTEIGRTHNAREATDAFNLARRTGFNNINLDLIYGLPGQDEQDWQQTMATALDLNPDHISIYELMVEAPSIFASRQKNNLLELPDIDAMILMDELTATQTHEHGFHRYEIANYAKNNLVCQHNINYWQNGSYIGLGAAAVSNFNGIRLLNIREPAAYIAKIKAGHLPIASGEILAWQASFRESIIMGLRMTDGVNLTELERRYNISTARYYGTILTELINAELITNENNYLKLSAKGLRLANRVMAELV